MVLTPYADFLSGILHHWALQKYLAYDKHHIASRIKIKKYSTG